MREKVESIKRIRGKSQLSGTVLLMFLLSYSFRDKDSSGGSGPGS